MKITSRCTTLFGAMPTAWPDAGNTGVPKGVALTKAESLDLVTDGEVVTGLDIEGCVDVHARNVTIRQSRITCDRKTWAVRTFDTTENLVIEDVEIDGSGALTGALLLGVFIYWGWESAVNLNEETEGDATAPGLAGLIIQQFGTVEAAIDAATATPDAIKRKTYRESLANNRDNILLSKELVTIHTEVPIEYSLDDDDRGFPAATPAGGGHSAPVRGRRRLQPRVPGADGGGRRVRVGRQLQ